MSLTSDEAIEMIKSVSRIGVREGKLAMLREVRKMVNDRKKVNRLVHDSHGQMAFKYYEIEDTAVIEQLDALIKREEGR